MTARQGGSSSQDKKKKQRAGQQEGILARFPSSQSTSSQRLEDIASQKSPFRDQQAKQTYLLRSTTVDVSGDHHSSPPRIEMESSSTIAATSPRLKDQGITNSKMAGNSINSQGDRPPNTDTLILPGTKEKSPLDNPPGDHNTPKIPPEQEVIKLADIMTRLDSLAGLSGKIDSMAEDIKQLRAIQVTTNKLVTEVAEIKTDVTDLQASVSTLEAGEEELQMNQQAIAKELLDLKQTVQQLQTQLSQQQSTPAPHDDFDLLKVKADMRCLNLIIEGIREPRSDRDGSTRRQVYNFCRNILSLPYVEIDTAYRLGKPRPSSALPRPMFVRFSRLCDREDVWRAKSRLYDRDYNQYSIKEDLPMQLRPVMAALQRVFQAAKKYPERFSVFIRDYKIYVNGVAYEVKDLEKLPKEIRPSHISTPGNSSVVVFFGKDSKFSNHYYAPFVVDDIEFATMEQFLAHSRARFADDQSLMDRAMASSDPAEAKRILNLLHGAPGQIFWEAERHDILRSGLLAKFSQNDDLKKYLLSSEERQLGEASRNRVWGIGLTLADKGRLNTKLWKGENLLGKTLVEVRQIILDSQHAQRRGSQAAQKAEDPSSETPTSPPQRMNEQTDQSDQINQTDRADSVSDLHNQVNDADGSQPEV